MNTSIRDVANTSYILVPIDEIELCIEDQIPLKKLLQDIEDNIEFEKNEYSTLLLSGTPYWVTYDGTCYQVALNDNAEIDGKKISNKRQASIQILKIILEHSSLNKKVSVYNYKMLKINLK